MRNPKQLNGNDLDLNLNSFPGFSGKSLDEIIYLGKPTIRQMLREWRCRLRRLSREIIQLEDDRHRMSPGKFLNRHANLVGQKKAVEAKARLLWSLEQEAEWKPIISPARSNEWISVGDSVICYVGPNEKFTPLQQGFMSGVVAGWSQGTATIAFAEPVRCHQFKEDRANFYYWQPNILRREEYKYLAEHPDFAKVWMNHTSPDWKPSHPRYIEADRFFGEMAAMNGSFS